MGTILFLLLYNVPAFLVHYYSLYTGMLLVLVLFNAYIKVEALKS